MATLIGGIVGGAIIIFLMGWIVDRLGFRNRSPRVRAVVPTLIAVIVATVLYGFGASSDGRWNPGDGLVTYPIGGLIAGVLRYFQLLGQAAKQQSNAIRGE